MGFGTVLARLGLFWAIITLVAVCGKLGSVLE